ncbi:jumonji domain-containing protein 6 [Boothiomyces sp. JEL0866]|nr:jumonji domain-containing protein 6 [Boothiomyces sp. JEL0866]
MKLPHIDEQKYIKKINICKQKTREDLKLNEWQRGNYHLYNYNNFVDNLNRIDYSTTEQEFEIYIRDGIPVVITGGMDKWPAYKKWTPTFLAYTYRYEKFKVGEDDDENIIYLSAKYFFNYCFKDGLVDDSPLYVFDAVKDSKHKYDPSSSQAACHLVDDYTVPKYFKNDLLELGGSRRPPFRWIVIGPGRSGTGMHTDPLGTSAWNALIQGEKRWVLFPPGTSKELVNPKNIDKEPCTWFATIYPKLKGKIEMVEIRQKPGEIVFVPGGWLHIVMNLNFCIAVTQNFCHPLNFDRVWLETRYSRNKLSEKIYKQLPDELKFCVECLKTVPRIASSSDDSTSESSSDSDVDVICQCHGIKRRKS